MDEAYLVSRFDGAAQLLPQTLRERARRLCRRDRAAAEELRLRIGRPATALLPEGEVPLGPEPVSPGELEGLLELATGASLHTARQALRQGYVAVRGGYRLGVAGTAVTENGRMASLRTVSYAALRISREARGSAETVLQQTTQGGFGSTLILSPPGGGKTTLLRDMVRLLSDRYRLRVSLADERGELAALWEGRPGMDVGRQTDVMDGCPKAQAAMALLRAMNPQVLAMDEVTDPADLEALEQAAYCGAALAATAHATEPGELARRPLYRRLLELGVFRYYVTVRRQGGERTYTVEEAKA